MKNMTLENITKACNGELFNAQSADTSKEAKGVVLDSRIVEEGYVFVATRGEKVDGHTFIGQVFEKGAMAVICEKLPEEPAGPCILVEDSFIALKEVAAFYRQCLDIKVVGITGSVGKTSTKEFVANVLAQKYKVHKTKGNFNNEVGLPLTVLGISEDTEIAVLEMGISDFGEMTRLSAIAKPDVCLITNIGTCHLENLGDRDGVLKAKTECFDNMNPQGNVVLNGDDDKLSTISEVYGNAPIRFGFHRDSDITVSSYTDKGLLGSDATIEVDYQGEKSSIAVRVPLPGRHMVINAMAATAMGKLFGLDDEEIKRGIESVQATSGRSNIVELEKYIVIDDCYNANPMSMKAAVDLLSTAAGRKVAILGDMFELGENEIALHAEVGAYAATKGIEVIICIGKLSKAMYDAAIAEVMCECQEMCYFEDIKSAMQALDRILLEKDTILVKASHGMKFNEILSSYFGM